MIEQRALVTRAENGEVWLQGLQQSACGACSQKAACGTATLAKMTAQKELKIPGAWEVQAGDEVMVAIDDASLLATSLLIYGLPLVLMLTLVLTASLLLPTAFEAWLPLIALGSLLLAFGLIRKLGKALSNPMLLNPQITKKC